jgi:hypothetical protein
MDFLEAMKYLHTFIAAIAAATLAVVSFATTVNFPWYPSTDHGPALQYVITNHHP